MVKTFTYTTIPRKVVPEKQYVEHNCCVINGKISIQPCVTRFSKPHSQLAPNGYRTSLPCVCDPSSNTPNKYITEIFRNNNCCYNQVITSANTNLSPNYYTTHYEYMQSRCQTIKQNIANLDVSANGLSWSNCPQLCYGQCPKTWYKPNNKTFSVQGAVSSSSRIAQLKYNTLAANGEYLATSQYKNLYKQFPCPYKKLNKRFPCPVNNVN